MKRLLGLIIIITTFFMSNLSSAQLVLHDPGLTVLVNYYLAASELTTPLLYLDSAGNTPGPRSQAQAVETAFSFAPTIGINSLDRLWINPGLLVNYAHPNSVLTVEDPLFIYTQQLKLEYWLGVIIDLWPNTAIGLRGFGLTERLPYYQDETLDHAYFSFQDFGGTVKLITTYQLGLAMESRIEGSWYQRTYPDYYNIYAAVEGDWRLQAGQDKGQPYNSNPNTQPTPPQLDDSAIIDPVPETIDLIESSLESEVLDYAVTNIRLGQMIGDPKALLSLDILLTWKLLHYQHVAQIQDDGSLDSAILRQDIYRDLTLLLYLTLHENHRFKLGYQYRNRSSNQNYFVYDDTINADVFIPSYYDYHYHALSIQYLFQLPLTIGDASPTGKLLWGLGQRDYQTRPSRQLTSAKPVMGQYNYTDPLKEYSWRFSVQLRQRLWAKWLHLTLQYHYQENRATTSLDVNPGYSFNYNFHLFGVGTEINF